MNSPILIGVTGTNGKTSVTSFVRQIANQLGLQAAAIGQRIEINDDVLPRGQIGTGPRALKRYLDDITDKGIQVVAVEVYSAALMREAHRGIIYDAGAFTNLTRDHLDVHGGFDAYRKAKFRFFDHIRDGGIVVVPDIAENNLIVQKTKSCFLRHIPVPSNDNLGEISFVHLNMLTAATLATQTFAKGKDMAELMAMLRLPPGRMEEFALQDKKIIVDFAHNPAGLQAVLSYYTYEGEKPDLILSSKGGWPRQKRQEMGAIAEDYAGCVYVCDDDPRREDPAIIRAQLKTVDTFEEMTSRRAAIRTAIARLKAGRTLVIAGRGADRYWAGPMGRYPYSDVEFIKGLGAVRTSNHLENNTGFFS